MTKADTLAPQIEDLGHRLAKAREMIRGVFIGQERVVDLVLITLLCGGHGVLVGLPGVGKTRLVEALSTVMGLRGNRVAEKLGRNPDAVYKALQRIYVTLAECIQKKLAALDTGDPIS